MAHYPDKAIIYAYNNVNAPVKGFDNTWLVNFLEGGEWKQKSFITNDGAMVFYYHKINEYKEYYRQLIIKQRSK